MEAEGIAFGRGGEGKFATPLIAGKFVPVCGNEGRMNFEVIIIEFEAAGGNHVFAERNGKLPE